MLGYIIAFIIGVVFHIKLPDLKQRFFAWSQNLECETYDAELKIFKDEGLKGLKDVKSSKADSGDGITCKILEVGVGTGANFHQYPQDCHLTVVDPNPHFKSYYDKNRANFPNIKSEEIIVGYGEDMHMVPSESMDAVVITMVLCSVKDIKKVLDHVKRVLVPGGKFFFVEHVKEFDPAKKTELMLQEWLSYTGIWPFFFDGCMLNIDSHKDVEKAGFSEVTYKELRAPYPDYPLKLIQPCVVGVATK